MVFVERLEIRIEIRDVLPGLGDQHLLDMGYVSTRSDKDLHGLVEACGITSDTWTNQRREIRGPIAPDAFTQIVGSRSHPCAIGLHRVDFTIVCKHSERLGKGPCRLRVRRVSLMEYHEIGFEHRIT